MAIIVEVAMGILEIVLQVLLEGVGYLLWGTLDAVFTKAGGFLGGLMIGSVISFFLFCTLSSTWAATWWSCGVLVLSIGLGLLVEAAGSN